MKKLLIATTNPGKLDELKLFLSDLPLELVSLKDIAVSDTAEESGETFEENALLKARFYAALSGLTTLADDGGFEIDALGGEPGVRSHRWVHKFRDSSDEELIEYTFKKMKDVPLDQRTAQLRLVLALVKPNGDIVATSEESIRGIVPDEPSNVRHAGFPYRSILYLPEIGKYYNHKEFTKAETDRYNHRKRALDALRPYINSLLNEEV